MIFIDLNFKGLPSAIASFLVPTNEGPVLIETGPHSTLPHLESGIREAGYALSDIQGVFLSHIHLDHAGAAWCLAKQGAKVYVHHHGYRHLKDPQRLMASATRIYGDQMDELWGRMEAIPEAQLIAVNDSKGIQVGEKLFQPWYTPGHAIHHLAWQVDNVLFTGDVAGVKIGSGPVMPPCPPPDIDINLWINSINQIRKLNVDALYLTHYGIVNDIENHLDELQERLIAWADWMKPYWESKTPASQITPMFQDYVKQDLISQGLTNAEANIYEAANPSWMSVYGLIRYLDLYYPN